MMKGVATFLLLICLSWAVNAEVFSAKDASQTTKDLLSQQQPNGLWDSTKNSHYAANLLRQLSPATPLPNQAKACQSLNTSISQHAVSLSSSASLADELDKLDDLVSTAGAFQCSNIKLTQSQLTLIQRGLTSSVLRSVYHGTRCALAVPSVSSHGLHDFDFSRVPMIVSALAENDGTVLDSAKSEASSTSNSGKAMEILGKVLKALPDLVEPNSKYIQATVKKIEGVLSLGLTTSGSDLPTDWIVDFSSSSSSSVSVAGSLLHGFSSLSAALSQQIDVDKKEMQAVCHYLTQNKYVRAVSDKYWSYGGLRVCADNDVFVPVVLTLVSESPLTVKVTDVLERALPVSVAVRLLSATEVNQISKTQNVLLKEVNLQASGEKGQFVLSTSDAAKLKSGKAGFYSLRFDVTPKGSHYQSLHRVAKRVKITDATVPKSGRVVVGTAIRFEEAVNDASSIVKDVVFPSSYQGAAKADHSHIVHVLVTLQGQIQPAQIVLQLSSASGHVAQFVMSSKSKTKDGQYLAKLNFGGAEVVSVLSGSGDYALSVVVADALMDKPVDWKLGTLSLDLSGSPVPSSSSSSSSLPLLHHTFRKADSRPSKLLAYAFVPLSMLPLAGLIIMLGRFGVKLSLPSNPKELLTALLFQGCIVSFFLLYIVYWLRLNIFQALILSLPLSLLTVMTGNKALQMHATRTADKLKLQ